MSIISENVPTILIKVIKATFQTLWYADYIEMEFEAREYEKDRRFYEIPKSDDNAEKYNTYLVYKSDAEIISNKYTS